jgi:peptidoglycan/xylan/chitin deacetylase (PgdA/CDA1 family)
MPARELVVREVAGGMLCLTFDDGPGPSLTPRVAGVLGEHGARATFFLLGRRAERWPDIVDMLAAGGHELACHTHDHLHAWKHWPRLVAADIDRGYRTLSRWVPGDGLFRPPYGKSTPLTRRQVRRRGARIVRWTHDSRDTTHTELPEARAVVERVLRDSGGMVLLHDFDRERDEAYNRARAEHVLAVTDGLLRAARHRGFEVVTASEYLRRAGLAGSGAVR